MATAAKPGGDAATPQKENHLLVLKVMRLSRPNLVSNQPVTCETIDFPGTTLHEYTAGDPKTPKDLEAFGLGEFLALPQNFGNIYLGETFSSYISVHNDSTQNARDVSIKAELQTSSQRINLSDTSSKPASTLSPNGSIDMVVHHEVKELNIHILVCSVNYTTVDGERMFFRKFFKFQVMHPLAVKTKIYNLEDDVFLEAQVQNITATPMFIDVVKFEPGAPFTHVDLNVIADASVAEAVGYAGLGPDSSALPIGAADTPKLTFGLMSQLNPQDIRQYLYRLSPKVKGDKGARTSATIGKMDIVWKTNLGETGRLQTSQLPRKPPVLPEIHVSVVEVPSRIVLEKPFTVKCKIMNQSDRKLSLRLYAVKSRMTGVLVNGVSGEYIGEVAADSNKTIPLTLFPVAPGLQPIHGLRVIDLISGKGYDLDNIAEVFVYTSEQDQ
eukprot:Opistho-2@59080